MREFVFGYGSLAQCAVAPTRAYGPDGFIADLPGFVRRWGVAMDNRDDVPGYKYYTAPDGSRPAVFVAFLDVGEGEGTTNGLCLPVDARCLERLDGRERNYTRRDVSDRIDAGGARVWAYVGTADARARLARGRETGTAVIDGVYLGIVRAAFAALGAPELAACAGSLAPGDLPVTELIRHEI